MNTLYLIQCFDGNLQLGSIVQRGLSRRANANYTGQAKLFVTGSIPHKGTDATDLPMKYLNLTHDDVPEEVANTDSANPPVVGAGDGTMQLLS